MALHLYVPKSDLSAFSTRSVLPVGYTLLLLPTLVHAIVGGGFPVALQKISKVAVSFTSWYFGRMVCILGDSVEDENQ